MRTFLITAATLGLMAGSAVAQDEMAMADGPSISIGGSAKLGLVYKGETTVGNTNTVNMEPSTTFHSEMDITLTGEGVTDGGLTFGATATLEARSDGTDGPAPDVYVGGEMWKIIVGSPDRASDLAFSLGDIGFTGLGVDDIAEGPFKTIGSQARLELTLGATTVAFSVAQEDGQARTVTPAVPERSTMVTVDKVTVAPGVDAEIELVEGTGVAGKPAEYVIKDGTGTPYKPGVQGTHYFQVTTWDADSENFVAIAGSDPVNERSFDFAQQEAEGFTLRKAPERQPYQDAFKKAYRDREFVFNGEVGYGTGDTTARTPFVGPVGYAAEVSRTTNEKGQVTITKRTVSLANWYRNEDGDIIIGDQDNPTGADVTVWDESERETATGYDDALDAFWAYSNAFHLGDDNAVGNNPPANPPDGTDNTDTPRTTGLTSTEATEATPGVAAVLEKVEGTGEDGIPAQYRLKDGTGTAPVVSVTQEERKIILQEHVAAMVTPATKSKTHWTAGVKAALGPVSFGLGVDSNDSILASVGGSMDGFGGNIFYGRKDGADGGADTRSMGGEFKATFAEGTTMNAVYAQAETGNVKADGFGVGVTHVLGGGANLEAGFAQVEDQDKLSVGIAMKF